jgi:WD40-like Beta Propeller Repeat
MVVTPGSRGIPVMRHDGVVLEPGPGSASSGLKQGRVGRPRFCPWTRCRIALLLAAAIGLPWLPTLVDAPEGLPMQQAHGHTGALVWGFALSPDAQTIAMADSSGLVTLRHATRGWGIDRSLNIRGLALAFSADGRSLVVGGLGSDVVSCDLVHGDQERPLGIPVRDASDIQFSPDGRTLAVSSYRSCEIILWDIEARRERMTLRGHTSTVVNMAFTRWPVAGLGGERGLRDPALGPRHRTNAALFERVRGRLARLLTRRPLACHDRWPRDLGPDLGCPDRRPAQVDRPPCLTHS